MARTLLYLVRHGEQDPALGHSTDGGLSERGRRQADRLGRRLADMTFSTMHHSPLPRAVETAEVLADYLPDAPRHACDFAMDRTPVPSVEHRNEYPEPLLRWLDRVPNQERDEDALGLRAAVDHFGADSAEDRYELVVTHNFVIGWFVRHVLDAPTWRWMSLNQENCGLTIVRWDTNRPPALVCFNDIGHL
ncbi:histidine phosphatase family protein [Micromonospora inyonensis]|uniref:Probable phosphoglycerate mutase n=1 Tax=Micromonospora inyonensis TaxID=47866 RepID=A0A1C6R9X5_9ACTN|nr:histidine phosphatase family protein [Micromonospora inyonensis]SCL13787.1 probable phosphoglycerate mutase [Micromonospora inyonensis]